jgi:D-3-phosphoglycerate dehydrogenase / 2-oxoglutarate reductase
MPKVLVIDPVREAALSLFERRADIQLDQLGADPREEVILEHCADADAFLVGTTAITERIVSATPQLKVVSRRGVGYDSIDLAALRQRKIPLAIVGNANATSVAEQTLFFILALARQTLAYDRATRQGNWAIRESLATSDILGKTLLLVGFGRVGKAVAERALAFGMRILVLDPFLKPETIQRLEVEVVTDLHQALPQSDFVSLHAPLTPKTKGLIGSKELPLMKPTAFLISTARGGLVDEPALVRALGSGTIRGAGLDVFGTEPLPADHPLTQLDNVLLSPHAAALTLECANRMDTIAAKNCLDAIDGHLDPDFIVPND